MSGAGEYIQGVGLPEGRGGYTWGGLGIQEGRGGYTRGSRYTIGQEWVNQRAGVGIPEDRSRYARGQGWGRYTRGGRYTRRQGSIFGTLSVHTAHTWFRPGPELMTRTYLVFKREVVRHMVTFKGAYYGDLQFFTRTSYFNRAHTIIHKIYYHSHGDLQGYILW